MKKIRVRILYVLYRIRDGMNPWNYGGCLNPERWRSDINFSIDEDDCDDQSGMSVSDFLLSQKIHEMLRNYSYELGKECRISTIAIPLSWEERAFRVIYQRKV